MTIQKTTRDYILDNTDGDFPCVSIPNWLFTTEPYACLSQDAKLVYALLRPTRHTDVGQKIFLSNSDKSDDLINKVRYMLACRKRTAEKVIRELSNADLLAVA